MLSSSLFPLHVFAMRLDFMDILTFPVSLTGVLSHLTVLRTMLPSTDHTTEPPGELKVFEERLVPGEDGGLGEVGRRAGVERGEEH